MGYTAVGFRLGFGVTIERVPPCAVLWYAEQRVQLLALTPVHKMTTEQASQAQTLLLLLCFLFTSPTSRVHSLPVQPWQQHPGTTG